MLSSGTQVDQNWPLGCHLLALVSHSRIFVLKSVTLLLHIIFQLNPRDQ